MNSITIIFLGVLCIGAMIGFDVFISRDLEKPAKENKNSEDEKKMSNTNKIRLNKVH